MATSRSRPRPLSGASGAVSSPAPSRMPSSTDKIASSAVRRGVQPSTSRALSTFISGIARASSSRPGAAGASRRCQPAVTAALASGPETGTTRAPSSSASVCGSSTGSAARLKAPLTGVVTASRNASAASSACSTWSLSPGTSGTNGIRPALTSRRGRKGPANSLRCSLAAARWKMNPGRMRTTRMPGLSFSNTSSTRST